MTTIMDRIFGLTANQSLIIWKIFALFLSVSGVFGLMANTPTEPPETNGTIYIDSYGDIWEFDTWEEFIQHVIEHVNDKVEIDYGDH